jgi:hypothetical protein
VKELRCHLVMSFHAFDRLERARARERDVSDALHLFVIGMMNSLLSLGESDNQLELIRASIEWNQSEMKISVLS